MKASSIAIAIAAAWGCATTAAQRPADRITTKDIEGPLRFLSDDLLEGRAPGTRGSEVAIKYLASELEAAGYVGGLVGADGKRSFLQPVPLVKYTSRSPKTITFEHGGQKLELDADGDSAQVVVRSFADAAVIQTDHAELLFVGYGITAPEHGWDDYAGKDVRGKVVVLLNFNPPWAGERVRLQSGRWDYKFDNAARHGAAGALLIHTTESAGYPWQVVSASQRQTGYSLPPEGEPRTPFQGWLTEDAARRIFQLGHRDLDTEAKTATDPAGKGAPETPLRVTASFTLSVTHETIQSANVLGLLPGTDATLRDELVVYSAHHDHLGMRPAAPGVDGIYNGALDNASGCATLLAIARAAAASPPKRSLLFLFVTAEEQGLLGSRWYARHPSVPAGRIAADINVDSVNRFGRTSDVSLLGLGKSSLDAIVKDVAASQGRTIHGDPFPDRGSFYRSDQLEFARIGVPVVYAKGGPHYLGRPDQWGQEQHAEYERKHYHQPSDEYPRAPDGWDLSGALEDAKLQLEVGLRIADDPQLPRWTPGDEFESARKQAAR